ncbi:hypothetical protein KP003_02905 [Geomonas nitrogeniifigens]|uniref:hypothetical protein n=1 Tax=Geomonas diazotrophica TaxID=2843197 RepID=UPI001C2BDA2A|nr:hypothetical protein [Geomonas nitrogeniifigens]QXE87374.1 hypothetical protein KP003_02905 [Geomonas nitrogeniifigens]
MGRVKTLYQEYGPAWLPLPSHEVQEADTATGALQQDGRRVIPLHRGKGARVTLKKHYLGVDPGKNGGLAVLRADGVLMEYTRMPVDKIRIADWLRRIRDAYPTIIIIAERAQAMPKQGVTSSFNYGRHFGIFEDAAILLKTAYHEVRPAIWKKAMGLSSHKRDSISACRCLFPHVDLIPKNCRTEHDGIAEAVLIAEWARQKQL